jgi:hypothetical protein
VVLFLFLFSFFHDYKQTVMICSQALERLREQRDQWARLEQLTCLRASPSAICWNWGTSSFLNN